MTPKPASRPPLAQPLDIAAAARAEGEVVAAHDVARAQALQQHVVDEGVGGSAANAGSKRCASTACTPYCASSRSLGGRQGEAERAGVGHEEAARMRLEGERHQRRAERRGLLAARAEQRLVAAMHAVEIAERDHAARPRAGVACQSSKTGIMRSSRRVAPRHRARWPRRRSPPCRRSGTGS